LLFSINVHSQLVSDFTTINSNTGCGSLIVEFEDLTTGNPDTWFWDFGNGNTSNVQNPITFYSSPGTYTVKLTTSNAVSQDIHTQVDYITVYSKPIVNFTEDKNIFCKPYEVNFTDISPGGNNIISWQWDFGDGGNSTNQNPSYVYQNSGIFTVTLNVLDDKGCENIYIRNNLIESKETPESNFSSNISITCDSVKEITFLNNSQNGINFMWDFGDGNFSNQSSPVHNYSAGLYSVALIVDNGVCSDTLIQTDMIEVGATAVLDIIADTNSICKLSDIQFTESSNYNFDSWLWDFGDGANSTTQNPTHYYQESGFYTVSLTGSINGECVNTIEKANLVQVFDEPNIVFSSSQLYSCNLPFNVSFNDNTPGASEWFWDFGNGDSSNLQNPNIDYSSYGEFDVKLSVVDYNGCVSSVTELDFITTDLLVPSFTVSDSIICESDTISFYDMSISSSPIVSYLWNFGDGSSSNFINPRHQFNSIDMFDISLNIENEKGCTKELYLNDFIKTVGPPNSDFHSNKLISCAGDDIQFSDLSSSLASINIWYWDFGDDNFSTSQNPIHQYNSTGTYSVSLVTGEGNCIDTIVKENLIEVIEPYSYFDTKHSCDNPFIVNFDNLSMGADEVEWDFGDGNFSSDYSPAHLYSDTGTYLVRLSVLNNVTLCTHEYTQSIIINVPLADFTYLINANNSFEDSVVCLPKKKSHLSILSSNVRNYRIDWGDGYLGINRSDHLYAHPGIYDVSLMITDINGCKDTLTKYEMFRVTNVDTDFSISSMSGCDSINVEFVDLSSVNSTVYWDFGDGNSSINNNPLHIYTAEGVYDVTLYSISVDGCKDTLTRKEYVKFKYPTIDFNLNKYKICVGDSVYFTNLSEGIGLEYDWDFGNGIISILKDPIFNAVSEGTFPISLTVTDTFGCSLSKNSDTIFAQEVIADFTSDIITSSCPPLISTFVNNSVGNMLEYTWDFGDGTYSNQINPSHLFVNSGLFDIGLIVTDNFLCSDTIKYTELISIYGPTGSFTFSTNKLCDYDSVEFLSNVQNTDFFLWDFGDGSYSNDSNPSYRYSNGDIFYPILIIENSDGCQTIINSQDSILVVEINIDAGPDKNLCLGDSILLQSIGNSTMYTWDYSPFILNHDSANTLVYPDNSTMFYVTNTDGVCFKSDSIYVFVDSNIPQPSFYTFNNCYGDSMEFYGNSGINASSFSWEWTILQEKLYSQLDYFKFDSVGIFEVNLNVINLDNNCDANINQTVEVYPTPNANFRADNVCFGEKTKFINLSSESITSFIWNFGDEYQSSSELHPTLLFTSSGIFNPTLVVYSEIGCSSSISKEVIVFDKPKVFLENYESCVESEIDFSSLILLDNDYITNWKWDFGDSSVSSDLEAPSHTYNDYGQYDVELIVESNHGCFDREVTKVLVYPNPIIDFSTEQVCFLDETKFTSHSYINQGYLQYFDWSFGDGNYSNFKNSSNSFLVPGIYPVSLTVTSTMGCQSSEVKDIQIFSLPQIDYLVDTNICESDEIKFINLTKSEDKIIDYIWNFGEGNSSNLKNPKHTYSNSGTYDISLLVVTENGCMREQERRNLINVYDNPTSKFNMSDNKVSLLDSEIIFTNTSNSDLYFEWNFDNGLIDYESKDISVTFEESGVYDVTLYVENENKCYDEVTHQVIVEEIFSVFVPKAFTPNNDGMNDIFVPTTNGVHSFEMKIFNRFGELVFLSNNKKLGWDGYSKYFGKYLEMGTYFFNIRVTDVNNKPWIYNGEVNLIK